LQESGPPLKIGNNKKYNERERWDGRKGGRRKDVTSRGSRPCSDRGEERRISERELKQTSGKKLILFLFKFYHEKERKVVHRWTAC